MIAPEIAPEGLVPCPPPDPNPHPPRHLPPAGACDCHVHVFDGARYPYSSARGYTPPDAPLAVLADMQRALGLSRAVLVQASVHGTDNRAVLESAATDLSRYRAVVAVGGDVSDAELRRMDEAGARGIRVNLVDRGGMALASRDELVALAHRVAPLGWHVEFLVHVEQSAEFRELARALPVDVVVGHLGYTPTARGLDDPGYRDFLSLVEEGRCWVKLSGPYRITSERHPPYADVGAVAAKLVEIRPDRLLWGTDWPHVMCRLPMPNDGDLLDALEDWIPDEIARRAILVENPARLYGFD